MKRVHPSRIDGVIRVPGSKSEAQRRIAMAVLTRSRTVLRGATLCEDVQAALRVAGSLGAVVEHDSEGISIVGPEALRAGDLHCGESGLCLRSFAAIAALAPGASRLHASGSLTRRPMDMLVQPLEHLGARCRTTGGFPPVLVQGPLRGGETVLDASVTSQVLTGLLLALPSAPEDSTISVTTLHSAPYVRMTLDLLARAGVAIRASPDLRRFRIPGRQRLEPLSEEIEGDWSGASFLLVAGALSGRVTLEGLRLDSRQADRRILEVLRLAGASVTADGGRVTVGLGPLRALEFDATDCPDLVPPLAALAACIEGTSTFLGAGRLRSKESDRARALRQTLGALGIPVENEGDRMRIHGGRPRGGPVEVFGDHRIAMAMAVVGLRAEGPVTIPGDRCVEKSYPSFFEDLARLGARIEEVP